MMGFLTGLLSSAAVVAAWGGVCRAYYRRAIGADEVHFVTTNDGWRVALSRYGAAPGIHRRSPVLLCHGLGSNRLTFDLDPERSLARHLAQRGYDVWVIDLRGAGLSEKPGLFNGRRYDWTFDDYLLRDVPAAIRHVLEKSGAPNLHWIGLSMGGILLYAHLARGGSSEIRSGVAIGSSLDYSASQSEFHSLLPFRGLASKIPTIPLGPFALLLAPLAGRVPNRFERFDYWPPNLEPRLARRLFAAGMTSISAPLLGQLATAFDSGGLRSRDGSIRYLDALRGATTPVLTLAGDEDRQCPLDAAQGTLDALGSTDKKLLFFGPKQGHAEHYGHFDLVIGRHAPEETWPAIDAWLDAHDAG